MYCKKKYGNNNNQNNYYNYMVMPPVPKLPNASEIGTSPPTLHPSAPIFKPKAEILNQTTTATNVGTNETTTPSTPTSNVQEIDEHHTETIQQSTTNDQELSQQQPEQQQVPEDQLEEPTTSDPGQESCPTGPVDLELYPAALLPYLDFGGRTPIMGYHPLQGIWTLWYLETDRSKTWEEMQNEISSINSVEDFWRLYNHIKPASEIKVGSDYSLFRHGIRPMWEDEGNRNGGRWIITLPRFCPNQELDSIWLDTLLCLIGETFEYASQICGAVVNIRSKQNKISLWTSNGSDDRAILSIGFRLRDVMCLHPQQMQYQLHRDTMSRNAAGIAPKYII